jgi:hypothetical protein
MIKMVWITDLDGQIINTNTIVSLGFGNKYLGKAVYATTMNGTAWKIHIAATHMAAKEYIKRFAAKLNVERL